jgi:hypothetical protein
VRRSTGRPLLRTSFVPTQEALHTEPIRIISGRSTPSTRNEKGGQKFSFLIIWPIRRLHHSSYLLARGNLKPSQQFPVIVVHYPPIQQAIPASSGTFSDVAYVLVAPSRQRLSLYCESAFCLHTPRIPGWSDEQVFPASSCVRLSIPFISLVANVSLATFERGEQCFDTVRPQLIYPALPVLAHQSPMEAGHCTFVPPPAVSIYLTRPFAIPSQWQK